MQEELSPSQIPSVKKRQAKKKKQVSETISHQPSIHYRGINIYQAAEQGNLPLCVLLWGMASSKRINLISPDQFGNNPMHYAALSSSSEIITFLVQQTNGYFTKDIKLVDSRNNFGETPLLKAMVIGLIPVVKSLLDEGSNPMIVDYQGNSIFHVLAKSGNIWCLNFMFTVISNMHGFQAAVELLTFLDNEGHSVLDWAADQGDVNLIEYLIRKGLNPFRVDPLGRGPLFWAAKSQKIEAARFLLLCGCNPNQLDSTNQSPVSIAKFNGNIELIQILSLSYPIIREIPLLNNAIIYTNVLYSIPMYYHRKGEYRTNVIYHKNSSRLSMTLLYFAIFTSSWIFLAFFPFFSWILLNALMYYYYRKLSRKSDNAILSRRDIIFRAPEKGLGFWLSLVFVYLVYLFTSYFYAIEQTSDIPNNYPKDSHNIFQIKGISGAIEDSFLFWCTCMFFVISIFLWLKIVWITPDPGIIDTRFHNFDEILLQSLISEGQPNHTYYCRTTLVKKPLRSKYCVRTGAVIARMDHYCIWLNTTIGYKNHRTFIFFLISHFLTTFCTTILGCKALFRDLQKEMACFVVSRLLSQDFALVFVFTCINGLACIIIFALLYDQFINMGLNLTINEKINKTKYSWLDEDDKGLHSRFDRGFFMNIMEFWRVPGFSTDYMKSFQMPSPPGEYSFQFLEQNPSLSNDDSQQESIRDVEMGNT